MTSQVIQKRDTSFVVLLQLYRFVCRSSWALEVHAVLSGFVCIKKYSCCCLWFSGQKSEYRLQDHLWWKRLLLTLMTLWQKRRACNFTHNNSQLKPTGAPRRWSLITSHQSPMQMSYYAVIVPFSHAQWLPLGTGCNCDLRKTSQNELKCRHPAGAPVAQSVSARYL